MVGKRAKALAILVSLSAMLAAATPACAQGLIPPPATALPPPPPPPPPPVIEVPKVPKMDDMPAPPKAALPQSGSFGERMSRCMDDAAAAGLGPNERAAYSRACANQ
jgi:hypothetical protein